MQVEKTSMSLTLETVEHIAKLAHLSLTEEEKRLFQEQLSAILDYAQRLQELDTKAIPPTASTLPIDSVMRPDQVQPSISPETIRSNAPAWEDQLFRVPAVLE